MPSLRQWEYFVAVAELETFSAAAEELHVSQPGLSQQVRALEGELGGALFDRLPRRATLTPLGRAVLPHARSVAADAARALKAASAVIGLTRGSIDVVTITSIGLGVLPGVLEAWVAEYPETDINLIEHQSVDAVVAAMRAGEGDVAVSPKPRSWVGPGEALGREEFVVVAKADDPRRGEGRVRLSALADDTWVQFAQEHGLAGVLDQYAAEEGFVPRIAMRTPQTAAVPRFAAAGVGVGLVPGNILDAGFQGAVLRLEPPRTRAIWAFTRNDPDPLVAAFIRCLRAHVNLAVGPH